MDPIIIIQSLIFILFVCFSAFFSSAETAFTALNRVKLRTLVEQKKKGARTLEKVLENPKDLITAILIGNNVANIGASALATVVIMEFLTYFGIVNAAIALSIVTGVMTFIILILGEITPKTLAIKDPSSWALRITHPIRILIVLLSPFIKLFSLISLGISKLLGIATQVSQIITTEEVKAVLKIGEEEGILDKEEKEMMEGVFNVSEKIVREIMTPRPDSHCINITDSINNAVQLICDKGRSRIPVYEDKIDNIQGILYAKDLLKVSRDSKRPLREFLRSALFIPETKNIEDLLQQMKKSQCHIAIVIDEYGSMAGLVTMEDILEEIVGEIQDEHDRETKEVKKLRDNKFLIDASITIDDLEKHIPFTFPEEADYDTLSGFILSQLGHLPSQDETLRYENMSITVKKVQKQRVRTVELILEMESQNTP